MKRVRFLIAAIIVLPLLPTSAASIASAQGSGPMSATADVGGQSVTSSDPVTLITGDRVELVTMANGRQSARLISSRPGVAYRIQELSTGIVVVPSDAESLLASGRLDEQLFDVSALVRFGYDDGRRNDVPLLVAGQVPGELHAQTSSAPSGLGLTAVSAQKADTVRFWTSVRGAGPTTSVFTSGVDRVWLDGKAQLSDDRSAAQIGAPAAWRAGYTGKGVAVAVLDSGYDQQHPDLLDLRPVVPVDDHNAVRAGKPLEAKIIVGRQPGALAAPVTSVTAEVSYDDGAHWLAAGTEQEDNDWSVRLPGGGAPGGFASLRLTAQDSDGNAIDQTILRAWSLR